MRIFLAGNFIAFWHETAWTRALRELGHEVRTFEIAPRFQTPLGKAQFRLKLGPELNRINDLFVKEALDFKPDIVVCYRALTIYPSTIEKLRQKTRALLVCYNNDNIFSPRAGERTWRHFRRAIPYYDLHLVFRHSDISKYRESGAREAAMLRHHYLPWLHRRLPESGAENNAWTGDIGFFGHYEPDVRVEQLETLMRRVPAKYRLHGSKWEKHGRGRPWQNMDTGELQGEEYVRAINDTRIALCFLSNYYNFDTYTTRCFEIPACGTMMLSQRTDDLLTLYEEDKEAIFYDSADELVEKATYYLANDAARRRVAEAGWRRCVGGGYDIHSRMRQWLTVAEKMKGQP